YHHHPDLHNFPTRRTSDLERQIASGVVHTSTLYLIRGQVELAEKIARLSGIDNAKVFFTNSGTEANETALLAALTARKATEVLRSEEHTSELQSLRHIVCR